MYKYCTRTVCPTALEASGQPLVKQLLAVTLADRVTYDAAPSRGLLLTASTHGEVLIIYIARLL